MHRRQSNLSSNHSDIPLHSPLPQIPSPTVSPNLQHDTASRSYSWKTAKQSNILLTQTDLIRHFTCSSDQLRVLQVQSNVACTRSALSKSLHISRNRSKNVHEDSTDRQNIAPSGWNKQDDYLKSERQVKLGRHALQAVENVDFEETLLWDQPQDGSEKETKELGVWQLSSEGHDTNIWEVNICFIVKIRIKQNQMVNKRVSQHILQEKVP